MKSASNAVLPVPCGCLFLNEARGKREKTHRPPNFGPAVFCFEAKTKRRANTGFSVAGCPDLEKIPLFWGVCAKQENASDFGSNKFTGCKNKNRCKSNCYDRKSCFRSADKFTPEVYTLADRIKDCEMERSSLFCPALESGQERQNRKSGKTIFPRNWRKIRDSITGKLRLVKLIFSD